MNHFLYHLWHQLELWCEAHSQVGSLAGAAHLLYDNAGVQRRTHWEQKAHVDQKGTSVFDFTLQCEYKLWKQGLPILDAWDGFN